MRHLSGKDFWFVSELHGDAGMSAVFNEFLARAGYTGYWSHFNRRRAGVGIIVKNTFLNKFKRRDPEWTALAAGEIGCLRLYGDEGDLDLFSIYLPTGNQARGGAGLQQLRDQRRATMAEGLRPNTQALTVIAGDFNYVTDPEDRYSKESMAWTGGKDEREQRDWATKVEDSHNFHEIYQPMATHDSALARSRLDRVYTNHHVADQLDARYGCACLDWAPHLSHHRPLAFFRYKANRIGGPTVIDESIVKDDAWKLGVTLGYQDLLKDDPDRDDPFRKLFLLKQSIKDCSSRLMQEKRESAQLGACNLVDDKVGWTMKAVRAIEKGHRGVLLKCIQAYPQIGKLINPYDDNIRSRRGFTLLRDHAVQLHRECLLDELREIQQDEGSVEEGAIRNRRKRVQFKLSKLKPGNCCSIGAVKGRDGIIVSDPRLIINELRHYWGDVFSNSPCNAELLAKWGREDPSLPTWSHFQDCWVPSRCDMAKGIRAASKSAPGPDGIPYAAWRALGDLGVDILYEAAMLLTKGDMNRHLGNMDIFSKNDSHSFNVGNMVFLPKKTTGTHPLFGEFYSPGDVRPLVIVNTDNRLIANLFRRQWEPALESWISAAQQGFLPGRSMASNIIDVEFESMKTSLLEDRGGILLLDFRAAFPSISQEFLHQMLEILSLPSEVRWAVKNLYCGHRCNISFKDLCEEGFDIGAGIRQGCPLSPLLFALVIDIALRRIQRAIPSAKVRAFADDIALVLQDVDAALPILHSIFDELRQVAGLDLNKKKCILIPLWPSTVEQVKNELVISYPEWADLQVAYSGTYLGVSIGPEGAHGFWDAALQKYHKRAQDWGKAGLGLQYATLAYTVYVLPVLSFLAQFKAPDEDVLQIEEKALGAMVPGPYKWCVKADLFTLKEHYGQTRSFPSLANVGISARCRMLHFENLARGGLRIEAKLDAINTAMRNSTLSFGRQQLWTTWYQHGILQEMFGSLAQVSSAGLSVSQLKEKAAGPKDEEGTPPGSRNKRMKKNFQRTVRTELDKQFQLNPVSRMRFKLERWGLAGFPGPTAERFIKALAALKEWLPPRINAAVLRTAWNGWCTERRFQRHGPCLFGCGSWVQEDSVEHYAGCSVCVSFLRKRLQYRDPIDRGHLVVLGTHQVYPSQGNLMRLALWSYVLYRSFNHLRKAGARPPSGLSLPGIFEQYLRDAVNGHEGASAFLGSCWNPELRPQQSLIDEPMHTFP